MKIIENMKDDQFSFGFNLGRLSFIFLNFFFILSVFCLQIQINDEFLSSMEK